MKCLNCGFEFQGIGLYVAQLANDVQCPQCRQAMKIHRGPAAPVKIDKTFATQTQQVRVDQRGAEFQVEIKWLSKSSRMIIVFAAVFDLVTSAAVFVTFFSGQVLESKFGAVAGLLFFAGFSSVLSYLALCELLNKTTIVFRGNRLDFWTKPLSSQGPQSIDVSEIHNFTLERIVSGRQNRERVFEHFVNVCLRNGNTVRMCKVQDMNEAIFVEKFLEYRLGIKDDPNLDRIVF